MYLAAITILYGVGVYLYGTGVGWAWVVMLAVSIGAVGCWIEIFYIRINDIPRVTAHRVNNLFKKLIVIKLGSCFIIGMIVMHMTSFIFGLASAYLGIFLVDGITYIRACKQDRGRSRR